MNIFRFGMVIERAADGTFALYDPEHDYGRMRTLRSTHRYLHEAFDAAVQIERESCGVTFSAKGEAA